MGKEFYPCDLKIVQRFLSCIHGHLDPQLVDMKYRKVERFRLERNKFGKAFPPKKVVRCKNVIVVELLTQLFVIEAFFVFQVYGRVPVNLWSSFRRCAGRLNYAQSLTKH